MSGGVTAATVATYATAAAAVVGAVGSIQSASAAKKQQGAVPAIQPAVEPPQPQAAKNPDVDPLKRKNAGAAAVGPLAGPSSTMLTGVGGVDPSSLNLGKTTLLGG